MGAIINLRLARKARARNAREAKAAENRAAASVPQSARMQSRQIRFQEEQRHAANRREKPPVKNHNDNL